MNANLIFKWLRDPRFAAEPDAIPEVEPCFLPVEIVDHVPCDVTPKADKSAETFGSIEIDLAGGHRLRISGTYDPEALVHLVRGLSG